MVEEHGVLAVAQAPHLAAVISVYFQQFLKEKLTQRPAPAGNMTATPSGLRAKSSSSVNRRSKLNYDKEETLDVHKRTSLPI